MSFATHLSYDTTSSNYTYTGPVEGSCTCMNSPSCCLIFWSLILTSSSMLTTCQAILIAVREVSNAQIPLNVDFPTESGATSDFAEQSC